MAKFYHLISGYYRTLSIHKQRKYKPTPEITYKYYGISQIARMTFLTYENEDFEERRHLGAAINSNEDQ